MKIKLYGSPTCAKCFKIKEFFKEKGIEFEDINVFADKEKAKEMVKKSGQMEIPVVEVDGEFIVGYDKEKLEEVLKKKKWQNTK